MATDSWVPRSTAGAATWFAVLTGGATQDLAGAATVGATAAASFDEFAINGGGLLPPYVLIGSAVAGVVASGALAQTLAITGPRDSQDFVSRIAPDGALRAA